MPELSELKFKEITAFKPYPHQLKVAKLLREGKSAILCAPHKLWQNGGSFGSGRRFM